MIRFVNYCEPEPRESVLADRNPTCDVRAYVGGLQVCKHMYVRPSVPSVWLFASHWAHKKWSCLLANVRDTHARMLARANLLLLQRTNEPSSYAGRWSLLDSDQPQPWPDQPLTYYQKYRFYFQEYVPGFHAVSVPRQGWGIAAAGGHAEYVGSELVEVAAL